MSANQESDDRDQKTEVRSRKGGGGMMDMDIDEVRTLQPREVSTLKAAAWALWTGYGEGRYLCSPGETKAAERLIELSLVQKSVEQVSPPHFPVIECTNLGFQLYRKRYAEQPSERDESENVRQGSGPAADEAARKTG